MKEMEERVDQNILSSWREQGIITNEEVAFKTGDLYVAENVITRARRIIQPSVKESIRNRRVLKG